MATPTRDSGIRSDACATRNASNDREDLRKGVERDVEICYVYKMCYKRYVISKRDNGNYWEKHGNVRQCIRGNWKSKVKHSANSSTSIRDWKKHVVLDCRRVSMNIPELSKICSTNNFGLSLYIIIIYITRMMDNSKYTELTPRCSPSFLWRVETIHQQIDRFFASLDVQCLHVDVQWIQIAWFMMNHFMPFLGF